MKEVFTNLIAMMTFKSSRTCSTTVGLLKVLVTQSCLTLCDPMDCSPSGSSVHGDSPGKNTGVGCHFLLQGIFPTQGSNPHLLQAEGFLTTELPGYYNGESEKCESVSCSVVYPTLCDPMDCSPPGSSVCGILQARILEWVTISFFRGSS